MRMRVMPRPSISCDSASNSENLIAMPVSDRCPLGVGEVEEVVVLHLAAGDDGRLESGMEKCTRTSVPSGIGSCISMRCRPAEMLRAMALHSPNSSVDKITGNTFSNRIAAACSSNSS